MRAAPPREQQSGRVVCAPELAAEPRPRGGLPGGRAPCSQSRRQVPRPIRRKPMRKLRRSIAAVVTTFLVLSTLFGSALAQGAAVEPLDPPEQVRVAFVPILKFATLYVAKERGLFEQYGLDVSLDPVASGTEAIAFLEQGQIDVGGIAIVTSLWNGWNQGIDIRVFAPGGLEPFENSPTQLMVRKELFDSGEVDSVEELAGRVVAVAGGPGSGGEYLLAKALERGSLTIRDVEAQNLANADMPAAFEN